MEFEEVNNFIRTDKRVPQTETGEQFSPYNSLYHQPVARKPTLSNFVHRLKQHSSKTRFVTQYKKLSVSDSLLSGDDCDVIGDNASIRIIDPTRSCELLQEEVIDLGITRGQEKKPLKKVKINESANQIQGIRRFDSDTIASFEEPQGDVLSNERFITLDVAMGLIHKDVSDKNDEILKQIKRIEMNKEEITKYKQDLVNMQSQLDISHYSLASLKSDHIPDMKTHQINAFKNADKMKENKKKNVMLKIGFDRYRKAISLDTRLLELESKIKAAWKSDEIWAGIRDWGFLSILLFSLVIASFIAWQT